MRKKDIVELLQRARSAVKNEVAVRGRSGPLEHPHGQLAFERWLSAYRHQLEDLCSLQIHHCKNEQPKPNHNEAEPERY